MLLQDRLLVLGRHPAPEESFLLSLVDGSTDIQSILWLAPMREVDVLIFLRRMAKKNMIELAEPIAPPATREPALI